MTKDEALANALKAIRRACDKTDNFNHGDLASHEIMDELERELRQQFKTYRKRKSASDGNPQGGNEVPGEA